MGKKERLIMIKTNVIDSISFGGIVTIRDKLIEQQQQGKKIFRLESGDPSFSVFPNIKSAIRTALMENKTHYTAGAGIKELREALYNKVTKDNLIKTNSVDNVLVTNGAMHGLYIIFRSLCENNSEVIMPSPTWTETADNVSLSGGTPVFVPMASNKDYRYVAEDIEKYITDKTVAIVINSPHNPTGRVSTIEEIIDILDLAKKHNLWVVSDEAYEDILFDNTHVSAGMLEEEKVISVFSFSKSYAMSGLRLGYLVVNDPDMLLRMKKLLRCTINGVNSATQYGGLEAVTGDYKKDIASMIREYSNRKYMLYNALQTTRFLEPIEPEGAFYCWTKINEEWPGYNGETSAWSMTNYLADNFGIGSAPGCVFGKGEDNNSYVRFAFSCSTEQIYEASEILKNEL
jgi:aspartate aminotransferase